ncbi:alpha/beta-Hydrolases superfamily protein [Actinidia rufa]|uniref:Alpha/beta-Hydrolases superfamily protein n=1 Tax=Actinidia rufa TaxID=165716 RepID=A0A7J0GM55_9ERIC|nr:alpha/beta-Hydrolases superfamily protein [Actinidia rufa]
MEEEQHPPIPAPLLEGQRWRHRLATNLRLKTTIWSELSGVRISKRVSCTSTVEGSERLGLGVSPSESRIPNQWTKRQSRRCATASQFGCCGGGDSCGGDLGGGEVGGFGDGDGGGDSCGGDLGGGEGGFGDGDGNGDEAEVGGEAVAPPLTFEERDGDWWVLFFLHCRRRDYHLGVSSLQYLFSFIAIGGLFSAFPRCRTMHRNAPSMSSGSRTTRRAFEFGRTYVVKPKGKHQATIVWLHGLGDNGSRYNYYFSTLGSLLASKKPLWFVSGFDVGELSEDTPDDFEGLDASAVHVANLLSAEPSDIKLGIGGFSMGAATALYSATCFAQGKYTNGNPYPLNLRAVVGLSGWLPGSRSLRNKIVVSHEAARRAASLPILLCHGNCDEVVPYKFGEKSSHFLGLAGFRYLTFKSYDGIGHYTVPKEMDEVCNWLNGRLGLEGFRS